MTRSMHRRLQGIAFAFAGVVPVFTTTGCEDPILIVGDLPGIMRRVAGVPNSVGSNVDSLAILTRLDMPRGLATARDGTLYIADTGNARIVAVSPAGRASVIASSVGCVDACLVEPYAVDVANDGSIWIADPGAQRIFQLDPESGILEARVGSGVQGDSPDGTPALEAQLNAPTGIAISSDGGVYFSERGGHRIRWLQSPGVLRTLAGTGEAGYSDGSPATNARLNGPSGMTIVAGTLYFADEQNNRVRTVGLVGGGIRTIVGNGVAGYAETDTIAATAKLNRPRAVAVTPDASQLFIADAANGRVRVVNLSSGRISRFAGTGKPLFSGEGLDAADTSLEAPGGLAIHSDGTLFIADTGHQIVWRTPLRF